MRILEKAIFLDRDGTINKDSVHYIKSLEEFEIFPFTTEALKSMQDSGYHLIIITNQSGVGRGFLSENELNKIHNHLTEVLQEHHIRIRAIYVCPHLPEDNCDCRKPKIENLKKAAKKYNIDLENSWFIGDSEKDIVTGKNAKCKTVLVLSGVRGITAKDAEKWETSPDFITDNLLEAARIIEKLDKENK